MFIFTVLKLKEGIKSMYQLILNDSNKTLHVNILNEEQLYFPKQICKEKSDSLNIRFNKRDVEWILISDV